MLLYNHYLENGWIGPGRQESRVKIEVDLFAVVTQGFNILVEYSGSVGFYIDIMVKSIQDPIPTLDFLHEHVIKPIRMFCASDEGCVGVDLEEYILRQPMC